MGKFRQKLTLLTLSAALAAGLATPALSVNAQRYTPIRTYSGFEDVRSADWYYDEVKTCYEYGMMKGTSDTTFQPDGTFSVAEAAAVAARIRKLYREGDDTFPSTGGKWYTPYVDYMGISLWFAQEYERPISRAEMAQLFKVCLEEWEYDNINTFNSKTPPDLPDDLDPSFEMSIHELYWAGVLTGSDDAGTFHPNDSISRSEAAAIIARIIVPAQRVQHPLGTPTPFRANDGTISPAPEPRILRWDDPTRPYAREGDTFIAPDGKEYVLELDRKSGVVGYGLPIATDLGRVEAGETVKDGGYVTTLSRPEGSSNHYEINPLTGEGHWEGDWSAISREYSPTYHGTKDREISSDKNFIWFDFMGGWTLVMGNVE